MSNIVRCAVCGRTASWMFGGNRGRLGRSWPTCCGQLMDRVEDPPPPVDRTCRECSGPVDLYGHCQAGCDD